MTVLNGTALALREFFVIKREYEWLKAQWTRAVLTITTLFIMLVPIVVWIIEPSRATKSIMLSGTVGIIGHGVVYYFYRYKLLDIWSLAAITISGCIVVEVAGFKILYEILPQTLTNSIMFLLMGLITLGIFTYSVIYLRKIAKEVGIKYV